MFKVLAIAIFTFTVSLCLNATPNYANAADRATPVVAKMVGGTIEEIDNANRRVTIQTGGGKESFQVNDATILMGLHKGDRVSAETDDQGKVTRIVKLAPNMKGGPEGG